MDVEQSIWDRLWDTRSIGIHFPLHLNPGPNDPDNESLKPEDYPQPGRSAMAVMSRLSAEGGFVLAEYWRRPGCLVGMVEPNTPITLLRGKWGNIHGREGFEAVLKTLKLSKVQEISEMRSAPLLAARPRQGTLMRWHSIRQLVQNLVLGIKAPLTVRDLTPTFQEVMCAEFMRLPTEITGLPQMASLILPVGRTLRGLDIYGLSASGGLIAAQVTMQPSAACPGKVASLNGFIGENVTRVFFCDDLSPRVESDIQFYPLSHVFEKFVGTPSGKAWLANVSI
jgi:hypothetical protein